MADDYTANFPAVKEIWHKWDYERRIRTTFCAIDEGKYSGYEKGWCLGRFTQALPSEIRNNFKGAECVPAGPVHTGDSSSTNGDIVVVVVVSVVDVSVCASRR